MLNRTITAMFVLVLSASTLTNTRADGPRIAFIAGTPSHGYGAHEHYAGCKTIAESITAANPAASCIVTSNGWPADDEYLDAVDTIVIYSDGGGNHPAAAHMERLQTLLDSGKGLVCLHYAVEVVKGPVGDQFKQMLGGYFETDYSVNPHWTAEFEEFPTHPITKNIAPFSANDEWYFNMRFVDEMKGITPVLSAVAPASTMQRSDGPHSGNPDVRKKVAEGLPQHVAWAYERADGGRSFGFTGGHYHWNWANAQVLSLVRNAVLWSAGGEVPETIAVPKTIGQLSEGQDEDKPANFDSESIAKQFKLTAAVAPADPK